jgi:glycosyltransferase involved in cell wall biosynthesis
MTLENRVPTIAYIGTWLPSLSETFVYKELFAVRDTGWTIVPCSVYHPKRPINSEELADLASETTIVYSFSGGLRSLAELLTHPLNSISTLALGIRDGLRGEPRSLAGRIKCSIQALGSLGLARKLRARGVAHIHAHMANTPTTIAMYAAKQLGIGFSFTGHANDLFVHRSLLNEKLQRACFVACISDWHRRFYQSIVAVNQDKLPIIRCGVDIPPLEMSAQQSESSKVESTAPFRIVSVGRLVDKKGMDTLIRAIALIDPNHLIRCDIIGDGPLKPILAELIETLGLREKVFLRGACPNSEVLEAVRQCDVFVLACQRDAVTDDQDGIPVSLMEAMAQSKCVITTNLEPITELVIHERTGLTFPERDPISLAKVLEFVIADSRSRFRIAAVGRSHVEREFSKVGNVKKLVGFFLQCAPLGKFGSRRK